MTEDQVYDELILYLVRIDAEATTINPSRVKLTRIIRAHQSGPIPVDAYATVNLLAKVDNGEIDCEIYRDGTGAIADRVIMRKVRGIDYKFRVEVYAANALDFAGLFSASLRTSHAHTDLAPASVRIVGDATRAPELNEQRWEGRAFFDVEIGAPEDHDMLVDVIETGDVVYTGQAGGTAQYNRTIPYEKV
jgi:hypothetical protein